MKQSECSMTIMKYAAQNYIFRSNDVIYLMLTQDAGVPLRKDLPPGQEQQKQCPVLETKETALGGYKDGICGKQVEPKMAGVCRFVSGIVSIQSVSSCVYIYIYAR